MRASGEQNHGLVASTANASAYAIRATNTNAGTGSSAGPGIRVLAGGGTDADFDEVGTYRGAGEFCGANGIVAMAVATGGYGVAAFSDEAGGVGLYGASTSGSGVYGSTDTGHAVYSDGDAYVYGNLHATGTLSKGGGSFKIDHPLDPANKFLYHSFVESPDMLNVYSGTLTLDAKGEATVSLPDWFEALNRDTRIQLTAVGEFSPLYVKTKVQGGAFSIAGGKAGQEVYWQLTGIRQDAWANANRIPVEEDKPTAERGLYLHPTEHGQPGDKGIDAVRDAALRSRVSK
jgi:hypothetical protein